MSNERFLKYWKQLKLLPLCEWFNPESTHNLKALWRHLEESLTIPTPPSYPRQKDKSKNQKESP